MKTKQITQIVAALVLLSTLNPQLSTVFAGGSLTPPGAPAPTMKTLDEIEPRTPISSAPYTISASGSYYLTTNLTVTTGDAITISADGVTLDLKGFTIRSTAPTATGTGILLSGARKDITILNGHIRGGVTQSGGSYTGPGFANGIYCPATPSLNTRVAGVSVSGCLSRGINLDYGSAVVESCTVQTVGLYGITANIVKSSAAVECGFIGIGGRTVSDSYGTAVGAAADVGVTAVTAENCYGYCEGGVGLAATTALNCYGETIGGGGAGLRAFSIAQNCYGSTSGSQYGLKADDIAIGCRGQSNSGFGLFAYSANSCLGNSTSGTGLGATYGNFCFGSSVSVTTKYNMP